MLQDLPMVVLAAVLILVIAFIGYMTLHRWKTARTPNRQEAPEEAETLWLKREREHMRKR